MDTAPPDALAATRFPASDPLPDESGYVLVPSRGWLERLDGLTRDAGMVAKRVTDVIGAVTGLILLVPVLLAIAVLIRLDSPGPVLFRQRRLGRRRKMFWIYKFR